jgi:hypothetical protein
MWSNPREATTIDNYEPTSHSCRFQLISGHSPAPGSTSVLAVGLNEEMILKYVKYQEEHERKAEKLGLKY